jgi:hypothetical protein
MTLAQIVMEVIKVLTYVLDYYVARNSKKMEKRAVKARKVDFHATNDTTEHEDG